MTQQLLLPKYLTVEIAQEAVKIAIVAVMGATSFRLKRRHCHIVVLVPGVTDAREADYPDWPNYPLQPISLYETSMGDPTQWEHRYDNIARCKALQLWTDRSDGRTSPIPHLLFSGDTPYWGGVKREGIVVSCSGVQPWFDRLISGIAADSLIALAYDAYENDQKIKQGADFLS